MCVLLDSARTHLLLSGAGRNVVACYCGNSISLLGHQSDEMVVNIEMQLRVCSGIFRVSCYVLDKWLHGRSRAAACCLPELDR